MNLWALLSYVFECGDLNKNTYFTPEVVTMNLNRKIMSKLKNFSKWNIGGLCAEALRKKVMIQFLIYMGKKVFLCEIIFQKIAIYAYNSHLLF